MQSVPAWMYEAMTIVVFGMTIVVFVMGIFVVLAVPTRINRAFGGRSLAADFAAAIGLFAAVILGEA